MNCPPAISTPRAGRVPSWNASYGTSGQDLNPLPPESARLWKDLEAEPLLAGFVLVGGTALSMRIGHRVSEDFDFLIPENGLPILRVDALERKLANAGHIIDRNDNPAAYDEFLNAGICLRDYQRDYLVDHSVKMTLFSDPDTASLLLPGKPEGPRVAEFSEIFALKSLLAASRSKTRDWYDLYVLMTEYGFSVAHFVDVYKKANRLASVDIALNRLCSGKPDADDPGLEPLGKMPTIPELRAFFRDIRDRYERECGNNLRN
jgi:hypothetical protein